MAIYLTDLWPIENPDGYKIHFARWNQKSHPLDVWVRNRKDWEHWQQSRPKSRNDFNRPYIFSLAQFYHEPDTWLFGGVFRVTARHDRHYEVELTDQGEGFIGRLKIRSPYRARGTRVTMKYYSEFEVKEILSEPYSGRTFPGIEEVDLSFEELEALVQNGRPDWKAALENVKGVYLLTDTKTRKRYVGAAYGDGGVWSRLSDYIETGHGGNVGIKQLIKGEGIDYCRKFFRFALLEHRPLNSSDEKIQSREDYWKTILSTRGEEGLNRN